MLLACETQPASTLTGPFMGKLSWSEIAPAETMPPGTRCWTTQRDIASVVCIQVPVEDDCPCEHGPE